MDRATQILGDFEASVKTRVFAYVEYGNSRAFFRMPQAWFRAMPRPMNNPRPPAGFLPLILLSLLLAGRPFGSALAAETDPKAPAKDSEKPKPEAQLWVTKHTNHVGNATLAYTATAGTMLMKDDKDEPSALFGFTAYVKDGADPVERPIVFAYNGGPGSSSIWLHMGVLGPKRTDLVDLESNTRGPFRTVENESSILEEADLVMLDPVGTGFSRAVGKAEGKDFWGVDQEVSSVAKFIVQYPSRYGRWASPKFILGESYGGMRTGGIPSNFSRNTRLL